MAISSNVNVWSASWPVLQAIFLCLFDIFNFFLFILNLPSVIKMHLNIYNASTEAVNGNQHIYIMYYLKNFWDKTCFLNIFESLKNGSQLVTSAGRLRYACASKNKSSNRCFRSQFSSYASTSTMYKHPGATRLRCCTSWKSRKHYPTIFKRKSTISFLSTTMYSSTLPRSSSAIVGWKRTKLAVNTILPALINMSRASKWEYMKYKE